MNGRYPRSVSPNCIAPVSPVEAGARNVGKKPRIIGIRPVVPKLRRRMCLTRQSDQPVGRKNADHAQANGPT